MCDQARATRKNGWRSDLELENIWKMIEVESEIVNVSTEDVEENQAERDIVRTSERNEQIGYDSDETINNVAAVEDDDVKLIWDINIQCDNVIEARRPDLILVDKKAKSCVIIDVAIPGDCRIREKQIEKVEKYQILKRELKRLWSLKKVEVVPVAVGALGYISKGFSGWMETLGIKLNIGMVQKSVLLGKARILRKVLDM